MNQQYYYLDGETPLGPWAGAEMKGFVLSGRVRAKTYVCAAGGQEWSEAASLEEWSDWIGAEVARKPKPRNRPSDFQGAQTLTVAIAKPRSERSRGIYLILGICLGALGIHNFYVGRNKAGTIQFLLSIVLSWTVIVPMGVWVIALVEVLSNIEDAQGAEMDW